MNPTIVMATSALLGVTVGAAIGGGFAWLQMQALRRNALLAAGRQVPGWMRQLPGSASRVAFLMIALVLAQVLFPSASLPWTSAGALVACGVPLMLRLKARQSPS